MRHVPVLLNEVITLLDLKPNTNAIDCTLGDGGHGEAILVKIAPKGRLLGIDSDPESLLRAKQHLYNFGDRATYVRDNFSKVKEIVDREQFGPVMAILADLGWSSPQFSERGRGFSFEKEEPLDMRYNPEFRADVEILTAKEIINTYSQAELEWIFKMYGEEPLAKEIAIAICIARKKQPLVTTKDLVNIILDVYRTKLKSTREIPWIGGIHPATKVFQALRIETNQELEVLKQFLPQAMEVLSTGGRLAIITFHSLEDRIVKHFFKALEIKRHVRLLSKKPVIATPEELVINPRSRSAKLRVIEKM